MKILFFSDIVLKSMSHLYIDFNTTATNNGSFIITIIFPYKIFCDL